MSSNYLSVSVCICGKELLTTYSSSPYTIQEFSKENGEQIIDVPTYEGFFNLDTSVADTNSMCEVTNYQLTSDTAGTPFTDSSVIYMDSTGGNQLKIPLSNIYSSPKTVYLEATTLGGIKSYKAIEINVLDEFAHCDRSTIEQTALLVQGQILSTADPNLYFIDAFTGNCPVKVVKQQFPDG